MVVKESQENSQSVLASPSSLCNFDNQGLFSPCAISMYDPCSMSARLYTRTDLAPWPLYVCGFVENCEISCMV